jgi:hypothetical protein
MNLKSAFLKYVLVPTTLLLATIKGAKADESFKPFDNPSEIRTEQTETDKTNYFFLVSGKGEASSNNYQGAISGRALLKFDDEDIRLGFDASLGGAYEKNINAAQAKVDTFFAKYFNINDAFNLYLQAGAGFESNNISSDKMKLNLEEKIFTPKIKIGASNNDFIADITTSLGLGNYDLKLEGLKKSGNITGTNIRGNFRMILDGPIDVEAGLNFSYKVLENLWDELTFELGAGIIYEDSPLALQLGAYFRHQELITNGKTNSRNDFGLQAIGFYRASEQLDLYAGICGDTEKGLQIVFGFNLNLIKIKQKI